MSPSVLLLAGAAIAKVVSVGWLASIATSPVAVASRRRFLEVNKEGAQNLIALGVATPEAYASLVRDLAMLEETVEQGWDTPQLFGAASRVSSWKFFEHAYGATSGISRLARNTASSGFNAMKRGFSDMLDALDKRIDEATGADKKAP